MKYGIWCILPPAFKILCVAATIAMIGFWCYNYSLDLDLCLVDYRSYSSTQDSARPVMSLCFQDPFLEEKMSEYGVNKSLYLRYLRGDLGNQNMSTINYDNISISLKDYSQPYTVHWNNGSSIKYKPSEAYGRKIPYITYSGFY